VLGTQQNVAEVLFGEVGPEHQEACEVELAGGHRGNESVLQRAPKTLHSTLAGADSA
jgi:hypothetical protein